MRVRILERVQAIFDRDHHADFDGRLRALHVGADQRREISAGAGIGLGFLFYIKSPQLADVWAARLAPLYKASYNKYWIDELYDAIVVRPVLASSMRLWTFWDEKIVDGAVNGVAYVIEGLSAGLRLFQTGFVGTYALFFTLGVLALILHFLKG